MQGWSRGSPLRIPTENRRRGRPAKASTAAGLLAFGDLARASTGRRGQPEAALLLGLLHPAAGEIRRGQDAARRELAAAWRTRLARATTGRPAWALRLTLGGAPSSWHVVAGLPGAYHPARLTGAGGRGEATLNQARAAGADPGCPVALVAVTPQIARDELARLNAADAEPLPLEIAARHIVALVEARDPRAVRSACQSIYRDARRSRGRLDALMRPRAA